MELLLSQEYFVFFIILAFGLLIGRIKIKGISLDNSAVIFAAIIFGHFGYTVPEVFQKIGLILFIYTIGIQSGPGFFDAFQKYGRNLIITGIMIVLAGTAAAIPMGYFFDIDFKIIVGLVTGALTSTPGLAAAIEASQSPLASIGYGAAYPFGVIGVILFVRIIPRILKIDIRNEEELYKNSSGEEFPKIIHRNYVVANTNLDGKSLRELNIFKMTNATISRIKHGGASFAPNADSRLFSGDIVKAVGSKEALKKFSLLVGKETRQKIHLGRKYNVRRILVTNRDVINKTLKALSLTSMYGATVTRIRRSGVDLTPDANIKLRFGDKVTLVCSDDNMQEVISLLGDEHKRLTETNLLPICLGILAGILIGRIEIPIFGFSTVKLGVTGGILVTALTLSKIGKTGPIIWSLSTSVNQMLRQLGLLFFLAPVGTKAGAQLVSTVNQYGFKLFLIGGLITIIPLVVGTIIGKYVFKLNFITLLGVITGGMTSTPGLGAVSSMSGSNAPFEAYAAVYPAALVCVILCSQFLASL